jgi:hypothetical protein
MATLYKNGSELVRFDQLHASYSIRSNGKVLKNEGFGWKLCKLKPGKTAQDLRTSLETREASLSPEYRAYRKAVQAEFPLPVRWQYLTLRDLLGSDIDGIYSDLADRRVFTDLDTLQDLHELQQSSIAAKRLVPN